MPPSAQEQLDTRAIELSASSDAIIKLHLTECRDRYLEQRQAIEQIGRIARENVATLAQAMEANRRDFVLAMEANRTERDASTRRLYGVLWKGMTGLAGLLIAIIGFLVTQGGFLGHH